MSQRHDPTPPTLRGPFGEPLDVSEMVANMVVPGEAATIVITCDDDRTPRHVVMVTGTAGPADIHEVADVIERSLVDRPELAALVMVSVRTTDDHQAEDFDRLLDLTSRFDELGVELLDWWVWTTSTRVSMRSAAGLPNRW